MLSKRVLYDSGLVAGGVQVQTPVLDLLGLTGVEVLVDHTAGLATVSRDLDFQPFAEDGVTALEPALLLRRIFGGAAANGSDYDPGRARVYVGSNPPGGTSGVHKLYDQTSAPNTALDTGPLDVQDADSIEATAVPSAGTTAARLTGIRDDGTGPVYGANPPLAASSASFWGRGASMSNSGWGSVGYLGADPPRRVAANAAAAGAGNTVRLVVTARGRPPGTQAMQMALPPRAQLTLSAGGAASGRLIVVGNV